MRKVIQSASGAGYGVTDNTGLHTLSGMDDTSWFRLSTDSVDGGFYKLLDYLDCRIKALNFDLSPYRCIALPRSWVEEHGDRVDILISKGDWMLQDRGADIVTASAQLYHSGVWKLYASDGKFIRPIKVDPDDYNTYNVVVRGGEYIIGDNTAVEITPTSPISTIRLPRELFTQDGIMTIRVSADASDVVTTPVQGVYYMDDIVSMTATHVQMASHPDMPLAWDDFANVGDELCVFETDGEIRLIPFDAPLGYAMKEYQTVLTERRDGYGYYETYGFGPTVIAPLTDTLELRSVTIPSLCGVNDIYRTQSAITTAKMTDAETLRQLRDFVPSAYIRQCGTDDENKALVQYIKERLGY